jgi:hypothetical protein
VRRLPIVGSLAAVADRSFPSALHRIRPHAVRVPDRFALSNPVLPSHTRTLV